MHHILLIIDLKTIVVLRTHVTNILHAAPVALLISPSLGKILIKSLYDSIASALTVELVDVSVQKSRNELRKNYTYGNGPIFRIRPDNGLSI